MMGSFVSDSGIYKILCNPTGKVYIGSAININKRWGEHKKRLRKNIHHSKHLQSAWNMYGESSFSFSVVELCDKNSLIKTEQFYIDKYKACYKEHGYNMCKHAGSSLGMKTSAETKEKIRQSRLGFRHSEESKKNMGTSHIGSHRTIETRIRMSEAAKGRIVSEDTKLKISESWEHRVISKDTKDKMKKSHLGLKHKQETRDKIRDSRFGRPIKKRSMDDLRTMHDMRAKKYSVAEIAKHFGLCSGAIYANLRKPLEALWA